MPVLKLSRRTV